MATVVLKVAAAGRLKKTCGQQGISSLPLSKAEHGRHSVLKNSSGTKGYRPDSGYHADSISNFFVKHEAQTVCTIDGPCTKEMQTVANLQFATNKAHDIWVDFAGIPGSFFSFIENLVWSIFLFGHVIRWLLWWHIVYFW